MKPFSFPLYLKVRSEVSDANAPRYNALVKGSRDACIG